MPAIIYLITNTLNNKQYVGVTTNSLENRWRSHRSRARCDSSTHFHNAIRKYGENAFHCQVLEEVTTENASDRERYWIAELRPTYNSTSGGQDTFVISEDVRNKMSSSKIGINNPMYGRTGIDAPRYGVTHTSETRAKLADLARGNTNRRGATQTPEARAKMSAAKRGKPGRKLTPETRAKLSLIAKNRKRVASTGCFSLR